jgi:exo-beta-1,3-glucanase (GH17 family)
MVPNLINLSVRAAIEKLASHTSKIKVYGNGNVVEQSPRAFERTRGETECTIYGRTAR